jgi:oxygen-independent coproporphyrinogen-3 oxidase
MGLRTDEGVAAAELASLKLSRLPELADAGLIMAERDRLRATAAGRLVLDRVTRMLAE